MILDSFITMRVNNRHKKFYIEKGYDIKKHNIISIKIEDLLLNSNIKINVKCDICGTEKLLSYIKYNKNIKKYNYYSCSNKCAYDKNKKTYIDKYGTENPSQNIDILNKIKKTKLERYGDENYNNLEKIKKTCVERYGADTYFLSDNFLKDKVINIDNFKQYKIDVRRYTRRNKKELFQIWNGFDFYDNEYIKNNLTLKHLDKNYPSIDHKISVYEGFKKDKSPEEIGDLSNLCITKRCLNSKKGKIDYLIFSSTISS